MISDPIERDMSVTTIDSTPLVEPARLPQIWPTTVKELWQHIAWAKIFLFVASLFLFILAITLMKEGARGLATVVERWFAIGSPLNSLGFGWLFAYVIMSGSPVAASALTFFDAGIISKLDAYTMITGSRLGASFIVLFIGFLYVLRGRNRAESLGTGLLSLNVTGTTYIIGLGIGCLMLRSGILDNVQLQSGTLLNSITDLIFDPIARFLLGFLPQWALFAIGLGIILTSFSFFDRCLPQVTLKQSQLGRTSRLIYRPWVMFLLGASITLVSMSVSVSLGLLVPLSARGFIRRENLIPYIMGANISTFIDTLLAAVLLQNAAAFTIVLVEMVSITIVSIAILITIYRRYQLAMLASVDWVTSSNRNLVYFMIAIFVVPIILMIL